MDNNKLDDLGERWEKETEPTPISFVDGIPKERQTAIIDLVTLQRLAYNLVDADISEYSADKDIIKNFVATLTDEGDDKIYRLECWDTGGSERYRSLMPIYYKNSNVALIVYDIQG